MFRLISLALTEIPKKIFTIQNPSENYGEKLNNSSNPMFQLKVYSLKIKSSTECRAKISLLKAEHWGILVFAHSQKIFRCHVGKS